MIKNEEIFYNEKHQNFEIFNVGKIKKFFKKSFKEESKNQKLVKENNILIDNFKKDLKNMKKDFRERINNFREKVLNDSN